MPAPLSLDPQSRVYLHPVGLIAGATAQEAVARGHGCWLAGGPLAFTGCAVLSRHPDRPAAVAHSYAPVAGLLSLLHEHAPAAERLGTTLERLRAPRAGFAGRAGGWPALMGVVNVTPDSFSDGGRFLAADAAIAEGLRQVEDGADLIDVGGESTRPGAEPIGEDVERERVLPVIAGLRQRLATLPVSIDSRNAVTVRAALQAGATVVNDVSAFTHDADGLAAAAAAGASVVLMHMQGEPRTMQADPRYAHAPLDVYDYLADRVAACEAAGIPRARIAVDPGVGFGKTARHSAQLLDHLALFHGLGCVVLLGASRKSFIARLSRGEPVDRRLPGSLSAALAAVARGAQILRVHDVAETLQALNVWAAVGAAPAPEATDDALSA